MRKIVGTIKRKLYSEEHFKDIIDECPQRIDEIRTTKENILVLNKGRPVPLNMILGYFNIQIKEIEKPKTELRTVYVSIFHNKLARLTWSSSTLCKHRAKEHTTSGERFISQSKFEMMVPVDA